MAASMIDVIIPAHVARIASGQLARAVASVAAQTMPARTIIEFDTTGAGSATTRNRGLAKAEADWVAFLDSDDELHPQHVEHLYEHAMATGADLVYSWFDRVGYQDPWPEREGIPFDPAALRRGNFIPVTVLARRGAVLAAGGFIPDLTIAPPALCDEWGLWLRMLDLGYRIEHLPERTWTWNVHGGNTGGSPVRGDARPAGYRRPPAFERT